MKQTEDHQELKCCLFLCVDSYSQETVKQLSENSLLKDR